MNSFSGAVKVFIMFSPPKLCMLIHANIGTPLDVRSEMNIHVSGVNEGCKVYLTWFAPVQCLLAVINGTETSNSIVFPYKLQKYN